ncbi:MAG: VC0807 family protein [Acidimicrobiia bacterium]
MSVDFEIPKLRTLARHAIPNVVEGTIIPVGVFLLTLRLLGVWGAVAAGLLWAYGNILRRVVTQKRVPGILILGALTLTARSVLAASTGSTFIYFLQPTLGTALVAFAFLLSVPLGRPLAQRLAADFCPIPADVLADQRVRRFFLRISLLWAFTQFVNAGITIWLLVSQSVGTYVVAKTLLSMGLTGGAIAVSAFYFHRSMTRHGILRRKCTGAVGPVAA